MWRPARQLLQLNADARSGFGPPAELAAYHEREGFTAVAVQGSWLATRRPLRRFGFERGLAAQMA